MSSKLPMLLFSLILVGTDSLTIFSNIENLISNITADIADILISNDIFYSLEDLFNNTEIQELLSTIETLDSAIPEVVVSVNASLFFEDLADTNEEYGTYDFIVIGAGAGGTVIANRLSEISDWNILLLEAGGYGNSFTDIPAMADMLENTFYNWGYYTVPQESACLGLVNNMCPLPRGRGVGGSSLINALMYCRGSGIDFDNWAEHVENETWSYENVLPYFKKSENFVHRDLQAPVDNLYHSVGGYHNVEYSLPHLSLVDTFLEANVEAGWSVGDYNDQSGLGASPTQFNTKNGRRFDDGTGYIDPILNRTNVDVLTYSYVTKIIIDPDTKKAIGVNFLHETKNYTAYVTMEVILCAGAIGSPQILMLSGVGPESHLESLDIPVIQNLEVGSNLRDHPGFIGLAFTTNSSLEYDLLATQIVNYANGTGTLTKPFGVQGLGFYPSSWNNETGTENADIELIFMIPNIYQVFNPIRFTSDAALSLVVIPQTFKLLVNNLHPKSVGTLRLKSNNPIDYPLIDPRLLTDDEDEDINVLLEGVKIALDLVETEAFQKIEGTLTTKQMAACASHEYLSDDFWECTIRQATMGYYHPVSTCPMGPESNNGSVVDTVGRVYGISNLRVCDASIFPFTLSGHPHAQVLMVAEKISDFIKDDYLG